MDGKLMRCNTAASPKAAMRIEPIDSVDGDGTQSKQEAGDYEAGMRAVSAAQGDDDGHVLSAKAIAGAKA
jgi:hypothetical protein